MTFFKSVHKRDLFVKMGFLSSSSPAVTALLCLATFLVLSVHAADPEEIRDFAPPPTGTALDGNYFTSTRLRNINVNNKGALANVTAVNVNVFPALSGLGVSNALLVYPPGSVNVPHTHPRGTETLFIIEGTLEVGLIDTTAPVPMLFTQTLHKDDIFVFPRGLVHFQINKSKQTVRAYASFSSTNPGLVSLPRTLFGVNIDIDVLTKSFEVAPYVIKTLSAQQP
ncbi:hypothetical protein R1sor_020002 [Riccia sorocarpa]|uniref:Germin-like protein n=1 Tax=Riccia sorocarpa TaxID=122646 RepID=A0ABD3IHS2_9MARC